MAGKTEGKGDANDASTSATDGEEEVYDEGSKEEHDAAIQAKLRDEADALVKSAETAVEKSKAHADGAAEALKEAKARRAELGDK